MSAGSKKRIGCWGLPHPKENGVSLCRSRAHRIANSISIQLSMCLQRHRHMLHCVCVCECLCLCACEWVSVCTGELLHATGHCCAALPPRLLHCHLSPANDTMTLSTTTTTLLHPHSPPYCIMNIYPSHIPLVNAHTKYIAAGCRQLMPIGAH